MEELAETGSLWESLLSPRVASKGQVDDGVQDQRGKALEAKVRSGRYHERAPETLVFHGDVQFATLTGEFHLARGPRRARDAERGKVRRNREVVEARREEFVHESLMALIETTCQVDIGGCGEGEVLEKFGFGDGAAESQGSQ